MIDAAEFAGVPSTLFLVLWTQYLESKMPKGIFHDSKIIEIVESLDFDFSKYRIGPDDRLAIAIRKKIIAEQIEKFLISNPECAVVSLGCGLDTFSERFKHYKMNWYDLDLPHVIALRSRFFSESEKYRFISKSAMDLSWTDEIPKNKKTLFLIEGLLPYFSEREVKALLLHIEQQFSDKELLLHALSPWRTRWLHPEIKKASLQLGWGIETGNEIEDWFSKLRFQNEWYVHALHPSLWSLRKRILNLFPFFVRQEKIIHFAPVD